MATAEKSTVTVEEIVTVEKTVVTLELSVEEAQTLRDLLGYGVNGSGRRKHTDAIYYALGDAGFDAPYRPAADRDFTGIVTFK